MRKRIRRTVTKTPRILWYAAVALPRVATYQGASCHERISIVPSVHVRQQRLGDAACLRGRPPDLPLLLARGGVGAAADHPGPGPGLRQGTLLRRAEEARRRRPQH